MAIKYKNQYAGSSNVVNNQAELGLLLEKRTNYIVKKLNEATADELYKNTKKLFYDGYDPKKYKRTGEFINSITAYPVQKIKNGEYSASVGFDPSKINTFVYAKDGEWGVHISLGRRKITSFWDTYVNMMEHGWVIRSRSTGKDFVFHRRAGTNGMIKRTQEWTDNNINKIINQSISEFDNGSIKTNMNRKQRSMPF